MTVPGRVDGASDTGDASDTGHARGAGGAGSGGDASEPATAGGSGDPVVRDLEPEVGDVRKEVLAGLSRRPKIIPSKYFYDAAGSALFERITQQPEYYPTRIELELTREHAAAIAARCGPRCLLIEFGSGSGVKTRVLLAHVVDPVGYVPIDISRTALERSTRALGAEFPALEILPVLADYTRAIGLPAPRRTPARRVAYFPGSTIGNFIPEVAVDFLRRIAALCGDGGGLVIGVDRFKSADILLPAYDDAAGVTARFNLNLLARINRELGADFDLDAFRHAVLWVDDLRAPGLLHGIDMSQAVPGGWRHAADGIGRIEMHLISEREQRVRIGDETIDFAIGEPIVTEYSYKYTPEAFVALAAEAGFLPEAMWTDAGEHFAIHFLRRGGGVL